MKKFFYCLMGLVLIYACEQETDDYTRFFPRDSCREDAERPRAPGLHHSSGMVPQLLGNN